MAYWMPSIPNFVNADAAFVLNGTLYCVQYTVSTKHAFNCKTSMPDFFLLILIQDSINAVYVILVVPDKVTFKTMQFENLACMDQRRNFTPFVSSTDRLMVGKEATALVKRLAIMTASCWRTTYSK
eukprot:scaffold373107_cov39-Attheya_sp.AAC.1